MAIHPPPQIPSPFTEMQPPQEKEGKAGKIQQATILLSAVPAITKNTGIRKKCFFRLFYTNIYSATGFILKKPTSTYQKWGIL